MSTVAGLARPAAPRSQTTIDAESFDVTNLARPMGVIISSPDQAGETTALSIFGPCPAFGGAPNSVSVPSQRPIAKVSGSTQRVSCAIEPRRTRSCLNLDEDLGQLDAFECSVSRRVS